jgi:hypothetical protein
MFGILGINNRNINYITKLNPSKSIRLADNKYQTKQFLQARGIPVPNTLDLIKTRAQLWSYDFSQLSKQFVVKPNKWSRGRGIMVTSVVDPHLATSASWLHTWIHRYFWAPAQEDYALKTQGQVLTPHQYKTQCIQILDGAHSLKEQKDTILIEEKLIPWSGFEKFCEYGLADLRIICYKLIPVIGMLRMPTAVSDGKANLHAWGIWLGINMSTGKVTSMMQGRTAYHNIFPEEFAHLYHKKIPFRDDVLLYSSKIQFFVNLGYMALDRVITKNGPKLLELNARAGMEIQNITLAGLEDRLQKVRWLKVYTPEQWVMLSSHLFGQLRHNDHSKKIINLSQKGKIIYSNDEDTKPIVVRVKCDLSKSKNYMSPKIAQTLKKYHWSDYNLFLPDTEISFKHPIFHNSKQLISNQVTLGKDILSDFLIKPVDTFDPKISFINPKHIVENEISILHHIDQKIASIKIYTNLTKILRPTNYLEQFDNFITYRADYNPVFRYKFPRDKELQHTLDILHRLEEKYFWPKKLLQSKFASLLEHKITEQIHKIRLIQAYKTQNLDQIAMYNKILYGEFQDWLLQETQTLIVEYHRPPRSLLGPVLSKEHIKAQILEHLHRREITGVKVRFVDTMFSRLSITIWSVTKINILSTADIRQQELESLLAHEIDTHLVRHLHGSKKWRNIFKSGTSDYLRDEEGLAIYNAMQVSKQYDEDIYAICYKYHLCHRAQSLDFKQLVEYIHHLKNKTMTRSAFKTALRFKRWIKDTSIIHPGTVFCKDKLYLEWYKKISKRVEQGGNVSRLMIGKIKIEDLEYID